MSFDPSARYLGGYGPDDGTIEFYGRIQAILRPEMTVLDLGAGRGAWFEDDECDYRRQVRLIKGKVKAVIGADVDPIAETNRSIDQFVPIDQGKVNLPDRSVDLIIADYVLEHIEDPRVFSTEIDRLLKLGGYFCARTPHKYHYVSIAARFIPNNAHSKFTGRAQKKRKEIDVFPTFYRMNTQASLRSFFNMHRFFGYIYSPEPAYYFGNKSLFNILHKAQKVLPAALSGNIFWFSRKG